MDSLIDGITGKQPGAVNAKPTYQSFRGGESNRPEDEVQSGHLSPLLTAQLEKAF